MKDKKGLAVIDLFVFSGYVLVIIMFLGLAMLIFSLINTYLGQDVDIGNVNLQNATEDTFGKLSSALVNYGDSLGISLIFGMVIFMIGNAYFTSENYPKLMIVIDIIILVVAFIFAIYISQGYNYLITAETDGILDIYVDSLPKSSSFLLNLPAYIGVIGALVMIFSYTGFRRNSEEPNVLGY